MYTVKKITKENVTDLEFAYNDFFMRSYNDYGFEILPLEFPDIANFVESSIINIMGVYESNILKGFLIYNIIVDVVEVSIMHCVGPDNIVERKSALITALKEEVAGKEYKLISYAMIGIQKDFVVKIAAFGFDFVGQAIVNFKFSNEKSIQIFDKIKKLPVPEGIEIVNWDIKYAQELITLIHESFENMQDYKFDPRFLDLSGCEDILAKIVENVYGIFLPEKTKILLENSVPKGFCFVNLTTENIANIPIIGISPELKYKKLGQLLLSKALRDLIKDVMSGLLPLIELNATVDTDNLPAINMYRKLGFKESSNYLHAYCEL
ncbi:MAG: GNAT family N-acetyltransferase [bacterium]